MTTQQHIKNLASLLSWKKHYQQLQKQLQENPTETLIEILEAYPNQPDKIKQRIKQLLKEASQAKIINTDHIVQAILEKPESIEFLLETFPAETKKAVFLAIEKATPSWIARISRLEQLREKIIEALWEYPDKVIEIYRETNSNPPSELRELLVETEEGQVIEDYLEELKETLDQAGIPTGLAEKLLTITLKQIVDTGQLEEIPPSEMEEALKVLTKFTGTKATIEKLENTYRNKGPEAPWVIKQEIISFLKEKIKERSDKLGVNPPQLENKSINQLIEILETLEKSLETGIPIPELMKALEKLKEFPEPIRQKIINNKELLKEYTETKQIPYKKILVKSKQLIKQVLTPKPWKTIDYWPSEIAWSPDGERLAIDSSWVSEGMTHGELIIITYTGKVLWKKTQLAGGVHGIAWSPDGEKIAAGVGSKIVIFSSSGEKLWESENIGNEVECVAWSPDGEKIAAGVNWYSNFKWHGKIVVYSSSGEQLWKKDNLVSDKNKEVKVKCVAWSPDGEKIAAGVNWKDQNSKWHGKIVVYSSNGEQLWKSGELGRYVRSVAWSPDGKRIAVGTWYSNKVIVLSSTGGKLWEKDLGDSVWSVSWSPDGKKIAVGGDFDEVVVFSSRGDKLWEQNLGRRVYSVSWSPDGNLLAVGGSFGIVVFPVVGNKIYEQDSTKSILWDITDKMDCKAFDLVAGRMSLESFTFDGCDNEICSMFNGVIVGTSCPGRDRVLSDIAGFLLGKDYSSALAAGAFYWDAAPGEASGAGLWFSLLGAYKELSIAYLKFEAYGFGDVFLDWLLWFYENGLTGLGLLDASRKLKSAVKELSRLFDEFKSNVSVDALRSFLEAVSRGGPGFLLDALRDAVSGVLRVEAVVEEGVYRVCNRGFFPVTGVVDGFLRSIPPGGCVDAGGPGVVEVSAPGVGSRSVEIGGDKPIRVEPVEAPRVVREEAPVGASGSGLSLVLELARRGLKGFREGYGCSGGVFEAGVTGFTPDWINGGWSCCRLGCGGWGCAYRCERNDRTVVFKVPLGFEGLLEGGEVPSVSSRMLGKVVERTRVLMALRHPGIVGLLGYSAAGAPVLVYEYAGLGSLQWQLDHGWEPTVGDVVLIGVHVGDALRYIHSRGLVHGDVKPGNVFVNSEGRLLLGDFSGMVRLLSRTSRASSVLPRHYTIGWRAPEQVYRDLRERALNAGVENRIDVYQLGNLLLYLLTGDSVDGEEYEEARDATGGIEEPGLRVLVEKMLSPDPLDRPSVETVLSNLATVYQRLSEAEK